MKLTIGDKAPHFSTIDQDGNTVSLDQLKGKKIVLFFYPKDATPTCTVEACNLRDNHKSLTKAGYSIFGISTDNQVSHKKFHTKQALPYPLLVDESKEMVQKYGVWAEKSMFGNKYMGILRTTFIIDANGIITNIIEKVKSKEHASQILK